MKNHKNSKVYKLQVTKAVQVADHCFKRMHYAKIIGNLQKKTSSIVSFQLPIELFFV